jgi:hypothetical protein
MIYLLTRSVAIVAQKIHSNQALLKDGTCAIIIFKTEATHFFDAGDVNTVRRIADSYVILTLEIIAVHKWPPCVFYAPAS